MSPTHTPKILHSTTDPCTFKQNTRFYSLIPRQKNTMQCQQKEYMTGVPNMQIYPYIQMKSLKI